MLFKIIGCLLIVGGIIAIRWVLKYGPELWLAELVFIPSFLGIGIGVGMALWGQAFFNFFHGLFHMQHMQRNRKWWWLWLGLTAAVMAYNVVSLQRGKTLGPALEIAGLGRELEERGDIDAALQKYQEALNLQPRFPYGLALLGRAYHKLGEDDKALASYERALETSPRHFWVHYLIGQLYRDQGRYHDAIRKFNELAAMEDNWYNSNKVLGNIQYQNLAYGELGHCYAKIGDRQKALEAYERYLALTPSATDRKEVEKYVQKLKGEQQ